MCVTYEYYVFIEISIQDEYLVMIVKVMHMLDLLLMSVYVHCIV